VIQLTEFALMKTPLRNSLIIILLGLFSSCAEQFREIRGSENRGNAFLGGGLTSSTATKRSVKSTSESASPKQTIIPEEQVASEIAAESTPNPNPIEPEIEKTETNPTSVSQGQKSNVSGKDKKGQFHTLKKTKLSNPIKTLKKALSQRDNGDKVNGWLMALGIVGIISSILGMLIVLLLASEGWDSIIMDLLGFRSFSLGIDFLIVLLVLISSIWLVKSPTLEDANALKIAAIVLVALSVLPLFLIMI
jgi:hypothetical protein